MNNLMIGYFNPYPFTVKMSWTLDKYNFSASASSYVSRALWRLFVVGKTIKVSDPTSVEVEINDEEAKVFEDILRAGFHKKIAIWRKMIEKETSTPVMLKRLREILPVHILKKQLEK